MKTRYLPLAGMLVAGAIAGTPALALQPEPATIDMDPYAATPTLNLGASHDSNIYSAPTGEVDSGIFTVNPVLIARDEDGDEFNQILLSVTGGFYDNDSDDNYTDYATGFSGNYMLADNISTALGLRYTQGHDPRGSGGTIGCAATATCPTEPDVYNDAIVSLAGTLGTEESRGRVTADADFDAKRYTTNGARTQFREYDRAGTGVKFAWRVGGKTDAVLEVNLDDYDYSVDPAVTVAAPGGTLDSTNLEYLLGVEWEVSGKTTGYAKVGQQEKEFDSAARTDGDDAAWRAGLTWTPSKQTTLDASVFNRFDETDGTGDFASTTGYQLYLARVINERFEPYLSAVSTTKDYESVTVLRSDDNTNYTLGLNYKFRRWAVLGLSYSTTENDSTDATGALDYDRDVIALTANLTL